MKIYGLAVLGGLVLWGAAADAQLGVYGKLDYTHFGDTNGGGSNGFYGGTVGIYDDFLHLGPVRAGLDLRGGLAQGGNFDYRDALVGVRVAVKAPVLPFKPYAQASLGAAETKFTGPTAVGITASYHGNLIWQAFGGVDLTVFPHVDWRAVEVGVGKQSTASGFNYTAGPAVVTVGTGLVFRL